MIISPINTCKTNVYMSGKTNLPHKNKDISTQHRDSSFVTKLAQNFVVPYSRNSIIKFLESSPPQLAEGTDGTIYKYKRYAIKVAKNKDVSFEKEANALKKIPTNLMAQQKFRDYFKIGDKDVLVSDFVEGERKESLSERDLIKIFNAIFEHDKAGIIHGDLNLGNIIFQNNNTVSLIDYGNATIKDNSKTELYPDFVINTNALNFENTGLNDTVKKWKKEGTFDDNFKTYLKAKAQFYKRHSLFIKEKYPTNTEAFNYESNLAQVLKKHTQNVLDVEQNRIEVLDALEKADTTTTYKQNPIAAIEDWNLTIVKAIEFVERTNSMLQKNDLTDEERTYFTYQNNIAIKLLSTLDEWRIGTFDWLYKLKETNTIPTTELERKIKENWEKKN